MKDEELCVSPFQMRSLGVFCMWLSHVCSQHRIKKNTHTSLTEETKQKQKNKHNNLKNRFTEAK